MHRILSVVVLGLAQTVQPPTALLQQDEPLSRHDIERLLDVAEALIVGKSFVTYGGFGGGAITIGAGPRVVAANRGDRYVEWPGLAARGCDGAELAGVLELEWESGPAGWVATARATTEPRLFDSMFELWDTDLDEIQDAGTREIDGVPTRGLRYPYRVPDNARFEASWQSTWFDQRSGLSIRNEIEIESPEAMPYGYYFAFAPGLQAGPDASLERPDCVDGSHGRGPR